MSTAEVPIVPMPTGPRAKMIPVPDIADGCGPPTPALSPLPQLPVIPTISREDLLQKLQKRRKELRGGNGGGGITKGTVSKIIKGTENSKKESTGNLKVMEELMEKCGGDVDAFCKAAGIKKDLVPTIKKAIESLESGKGLRETLKSVANTVRRKQ